jgi:hypothetical protein
MTERSEGIDSTVRPVTSSDEGGPRTERSEGIDSTVRPVSLPTQEAT